MKEQPILFSAPMVRAILDGRKTQTRRVVKNTLGVCAACWAESCPHNAPDFDEELKHLAPYLRVGYCDHNEKSGSRLSPPWEPGSRLWVKETFRPTLFQGGTGMYSGTTSHQIEYAAHEGYLNSCKITQASDGTNYAGNPDGYGKLFRRAKYWTDMDRGKWTPSIFMPRWASRITLEIESIRVERLQDISESDAIEEGITWDEWSHDYIGAYRKLWESINGPCSWDSNPWVWVIAFRKL